MYTALLSPFKSFPFCFVMQVKACYLMKNCLLDVSQENSSDLDLFKNIKLPFTNVAD